MSVKQQVAKRSAAAPIVCRELFADHDRRSHGVKGDAGNPILAESGEKWVLIQAFRKHRLCQPN